MNGKSHIVFLNRCYPPEIGGTGKILQNLAHRLSIHYNVTLLVGEPIFSDRSQSKFIDKHIELMGESHVERLGSTSLSHSHMLGRICNYFTYLSLAFFRLLTLQPSPQAIVAMTDPPLACIIGAWGALLRNCHFIYSVQDLHPDMAIAANIVKNCWWVKCWDFIHTWAMKRAEIVMVLGEDMRAKVIEKGIASDRVVVLRHGADPIEIPRSMNHHLIREIRASSSFVVLYSGNIGFAGAWEAIIESAKELDGKDIRFVFVGEGTKKSELLELTKGFSHVAVLPYQLQDEFPYVLKAGDLHIVTVRPGLEGLVVPSKVYPLLVSGRPILAVAPETSDVVGLIKKFQCGFHADPSDHKSIIKAILFARDHQQELQVMGQRARKAGLEFSNDKMGMSMSKVLSSVIGEK